MRAVQQIPTREVLDGFQKSLRPCASNKKDEVAPALEGLNRIRKTWHVDLSCWYYERTPNQTEKMQITK